MRKVSARKFDRLMEGAIDLGRCPCCNNFHDIDIIVQFRAYGRQGPKIKCNTCGYETKVFPVYDCFSDGCRHGSPITKKTLMRGIYNAIRVFRRM